MELIQPVKQEVWGSPAVINFVLGGMGSGYYLLYCAAPYADTQISSRGVLLKLLGPLLVGIGLLALTTEAGRPLRGYHLIRNLRHSWMSRETVAALTFVTSAFLAVVFSESILQFLAIAGCAGLLISQALILFHARSVACWNAPLTAAMFTISSLSAGYGLLLSVSSFFPAPASSHFFRFGIILLIINMLMWFAFLHWRSNLAFRKDVAALRRIAGGARQKVAVLRKAAYLRAVVMGSPVLGVRQSMNSEASQPFLSECRPSSSKTVNGSTERL
jgi:DMSO reductase anchor subunit